MPFWYNTDRTGRVTQEMETEGNDHMEVFEAGSPLHCCLTGSHSYPSVHCVYVMVSSVSCDLTSARVSIVRKRAFNIVNLRGRAALRARAARGVRRGGQPRGSDLAVPHFLNPIYHCWTFGLVPSLCYCEYIFCLSNAAFPASENF